MKRFRKTLVASALLAATLGGCGHRTTLPPQAPEQGPKEKPPTVQNVARGLTYTERDRQGRLLYRVHSASSTQSQREMNATMEKTSVTIYQNGVPDMQVTAPSAKIDVKGRTIQMWGGLKAVAPRQKTVFRVDKMTWNMDTKKFLGTGSVEYHNGPITMYSDNVSGTTPVREVRLGESVRFTIAPKR